MTYQPQIRPCADAEGRGCGKKMIRVYQGPQGHHGQHLWTWNCQCQVGKPMQKLIYEMGSPPPEGIIFPDWRDVWDEVNGPQIIPTPESGEAYEKRITARDKKEKTLRLKEMKSQLKQLTKAQLIELFMEDENE
jgi:hypothetical protein